MKGVFATSSFLIFQQTMSKILRLASIAVIGFPMFCFAQEKIVLEPTYPAGKFLSKIEGEEVAYEIFHISHFDIRSNSPRKRKLEAEMTTQVAPPNAEGIVRADYATTKYRVSTESPDESKEELASSEEFHQLYSRVVCENPTWALIDLKARRVLEVHGCDQIVEKLYGAASEEMYRWAKSHLGNEARRERAESSLRSFPNNPISLGDQWKHLELVSLPGPLTRTELEFTNTLKEIKTDEAGQQIAVVAGRAEWKTDDPQKLGPWEQEFFQIEVTCDFVREYAIEDGVGFSSDSAERQIHVVAKTRIQYPHGLYMVAYVVKRTETVSPVEIEE